MGGIPLVTLNSHYQSSRASSGLNPSEVNLKLVQWLAVLWINLGSHILVIPTASRKTSTKCLVRFVVHNIKINCRAFTFEVAVSLKVLPIIMFFFYTCTNWFLIKNFFSNIYIFTLLCNYIFLVKRTICGWKTSSQDASHLNGALVELVFKRCSCFPVKSAENTSITAL